MRLRPASANATPRRPLIVLRPTYFFGRALLPAENEDLDDPDDKVEAHKAKWQDRKKKYQVYADKGKVEKLEKVMAKQQAKYEKAKSKGKPAEYLLYKQQKVDFTKALIKVAILVSHLKKAGLA